jgi:DNA-binding transcriptional MerR regulator
MRQLDLFGAFTDVKAEEKKPSEKVVAPVEKAEDIDTVSFEPEVAADEEIQQQVVDQFDEEELVGEETSDTLLIEVTSAEEAASNELVELSAEHDLLINEPEVGTVVNEGSAYEEIIPVNHDVSNLKKIIVTKTPAENSSNSENGSEQEVENPRKGSIIFNDGKITVKIKSKPSAIPVVIKEPDKLQKLAQKRGRKSFKEIDAEADLIEIPDDEILNQKQYYSISQVAQWFKVNTSLIRFWENEFDIIKPKKNKKGDRLFRPEDVKNLQLIYHLLRERKYTIEGAKEYLKTNKKKADTQLQLTHTLQKFKSFLLDLKANL